MLHKALRELTARYMPLWVKLAVFGAIGITVTHTLHLIIGNRLATRALAKQQVSLGTTIARFAAERCTNAILLDDIMGVQEIVSETSRLEGIEYCFVEAKGHGIASSFFQNTPRALIGLRDQTRRFRPLVVVDGRRRLLDIAVPILDGQAGTLRLGMTMTGLEAAKKRLSVTLGTLALFVILIGFIAAFVMGRKIARPLHEMFVMSESFDPSREPVRLATRSRDEIGTLTEKFNEMTARLHAAHQEREAARLGQVETERLAAMGSLVAGVAHEINNPLAGLKNCHRKLLIGDLDEDVRQEYLSLIDDGLDRIEKVVRRLLDFGRSAPLEKQRVDCRDIVRIGSKLALPLLEQRRIELRIDVPESIDSEVNVDLQKLSQALLNLLLNAAYVTTDGGQIRLGVIRRDGQVGISVEDDGPGIPEKIRSRIMDPFFTTKPTGEGTGLGLSVTRTIVEGHGGRLTFDFPPRGTRVTIWLPGIPR